MSSNEAQRRQWNDPVWTERWPKRERFTEAVTPLLIDALDLVVGERALDVGCGGGPTTIEVARHVGETGFVLGADISAPLVELATARAADAGIENVAFRVLDVQQDTIEQGPFDVVLSQFGVMFFEEPVTAFSNIARHLRSGGRLGFACWQSADKNLWLFGSSLADLLPPPPVPARGKSPTGPFAFADPSYVRTILDESGFIEVAVAPDELSITASEDSVVDDAQLRFLGIGEENMDEALAAAEAHIATFRQPDGQCRFDLAVQIVTALVPTS